MASPGLGSLPYCFSIVPLLGLLKFWKHFWTWDASLRHSLWLFLHAPSLRDVLWGYPLLWPLLIIHVRSCPALILVFILPAGPFLLSCLRPASKTLAPVLNICPFALVLAFLSILPISPNYSLHSVSSPGSPIMTSPLPSDQNLFPSTEPEDILFGWSKGSAPSRPDHGDKMGTWYPGPVFNSTFVFCWIQRVHLTVENGDHSAWLQIHKKTISKQINPIFVSTPITFINEFLPNYHM